MTTPSKRSVKSAGVEALVVRNGEPAAEPNRGDRHRGGATGVVKLGQVGGQGRVIEPPAVEPSVELAEGAGSGAAGVVGQRGVDQAARGRRGAADRRLEGIDPSGQILHDTGNRQRFMDCNFTSADVLVSGFWDCSTPHRSSTAYPSGRPTRRSCSARRKLR